MKLVVLNWLKDGVLPFIGRTIELIFRMVLSLLPLGVYMILLQKRSKASSVSAISTYTKENSRFQYVFPGFILVSIDPDSLNNSIAKTKSNVQNWINQNKYILTIMFMTIVVVLMILTYIGGK